MNRRNFLICSCIFILSGCNGGVHQQPIPLPAPIVQPIPEKRNIQGEVAVGKTKKEDLINIFGDPESIYTGENYVYFYFSVSRLNEIWSVLFVLDDGFKINRVFKKDEGFGVYFRRDGRVRNFDIM